jgi:hypothetical protein
MVLVRVSDVLIGSGKYERYQIGIRKAYKADSKPKLSLDSF